MDKDTQLSNKKEAAKILGIGINTVNSWVKRNIIKPIVEPGKRNKYVKKDIETLAKNVPNLKKGCGLYDIIGAKFGKLTVIKRAPNRNTRQSWWLCRCECGNEKEIRGLKLVRGHTKSCGCLVHEPSHNFTGCGKLSGTYWARVKRHAKNRNLEIKVSIKEAWKVFEKQNGKCALSGLPICLKRNLQLAYKEEKQTASLDRINSSIGYYIDNIQWVHVDVQKMKMNLPEDRFIFLCESIFKTCS